MDSSGRVNRLVVVAFLVTVVFSGGVAAQGDQPVWVGETEASLVDIVEGHNAAVDGTGLGPANRLVRDQRVTLTVSAPDGATAQFAFQTDAAAHVVDFQAGPHEDPTVRMFTDPATVDRIAASSDRTATFEAALRAGDVRVEGVGLVNRAAWALAGLALWALGAPLQAVAVGAVVLLGAGALAVAATNVVGGGTVLAGGTGTAGASTAGATVTGAGTTSATGATGASSAASGSAGVGGTGTGSTSTASSAGATPTGGSTVPPVAGGSEAAGEAMTQTGNTMTASTSLNPVSVADRVLSFFERALFIVAIVKKLASRVRRGVAAAAVGVLGWFGFARLTDDDDDDEPVGAETVDQPTPPTIRRRGVPRRRRR